MRIFSADACGNTFRILVAGNRQEAKQYLDNVTRFGLWNFDSALVLLPSQKATFRMEVWERDHSISDMCGNGVRAVGMLLRQMQLAPYLEVMNGLVLPIEYDHRHGQPQAVIGVVQQTHTVEVSPGVAVPVYSAAGEPHMVFLVPDVHTCGVESWGLDLVLTHHMNCTVVGLSGGTELYARTLERGVNRITRSCGTGASSATQLILDRGLIQSGSIKLRTHRHLLMVHQDSRSLVLQGEVTVDRLF